MPIFGAFSDRGSEPLEDHGSEVRLNVYDIVLHESYPKLNDVTICLGFGAFHTGIEVYRKEYAYGGHQFNSSGIFHTEPKQPYLKGLTFRKSILLGRTTRSEEQVEQILRKLEDKYRGSSYQLLGLNCNHFSDDFVKEMLGKSIPGWVNRLAYIAKMCQCFLPEEIRETKIPVDEASDALASDNMKRSSSSSDGEKDILLDSNTRYS